MQQLDIVNLALSRLGQPSISAMSEASTEAAQATAVWENALYTTLHAFRWPFCSKRVELALVEESPENYPYAYKYALPSDIIQPYEIIGDFPEQHIPFLVEGTYLYTDRETAVLSYTYKELRCSRFSPTFCDALSWRIAGDLSLSLAGASTYAQRAQQQYDACLMQARAQAAQSSEPKRNRHSRYMRARGYHIMRNL